MSLVEHDLTRANAIVNTAIEQAIGRGEEIGVQVAAYLDGKLVVDTWGGLADEASGKPVTADTLFNVFSVTKAVAATALHIQVDRGLLAYDGLIADYWPEYGVNGKERTKVRDVLTHRAGVPQMPAGVTPELMCDWDWMASEIAKLTPIAEPGTKALYLSMTFGWIIGELIRRTDPAKRSLGQFIHEEIALPLNAPDIWVGVPESEMSRVATLVNSQPPTPLEYLPALYQASMPHQVDLIPEVFQRPDVMRAEIAGVGGIFSARSSARFWAMLAQGGELDGVRILSEKLVRTFNEPRPHSDEPDPVMFDIVLPLSNSGFWLGGEFGPVFPVKNARAICHPGAGNSLGWADMDKRFAVAICHNRMSSPVGLNTILPIADAIREAAGIT